MTRLAAALSLAGLLLVGWAPAAVADAPPGRILFARGQSLWWMSPDGKGKPVEAAHLGVDAAAVRALHASPDGRLITIDLDGATRWLRLPQAAAAPAGAPTPAPAPAPTPAGAATPPAAPAPGGLPPVAATADALPTAEAIAGCAGPAVAGPDGSCLACPRAGGGVLLARVVEPRREVPLDLPADELQFLGPRGTDLVFADADRLWAVSLDAPTQRRALAPHRPTSDLSTAPDGTHAVGRYQTDDGDAAIFVFRLDGKAARRKLGGDGAPIAWSADSVWLLMQQGDTACLGRAVGGERKCWDDFRGVGVSPDGHWVLLAKPSAGKGGGVDLFVGVRAGTRPPPPHLVVEHASAAATWLP